MADATVKLKIETEIDNGLGQIADGLEGVGVAASSAAEDVSKLPRSINDIRGELKGLSKQLESADLGSDEFADLAKKSNALEKELKDARRAAKGAADAIQDVESSSRSANDGISFFSLTLADLASQGIQAVLSGAAQLGAALFEVGQESAGLASGAAETASLLDTVLGPSLESYESQIDAISKATGASTNQLKEGSKIFAVLADSAGFASDEVATLAAQTANTALDLNSFFDKDNALEAIGQAYKGESEGLAQFGVDVRQAALLDTAYRNGILETGEALDKQSTILAVNAAIQEQAAAAMGDAAKTADGFANTQRAITGLTEDYKTALGEVVVAGLQPFQKSLLKTGQKFLPDFQKQMADSVEGVGNFSKGLTTILENFDQIQNTNIGKSFEFIKDMTLIDEALAGVFGRFSDGVESVQQFGQAAEILEERQRKLNETLAESDSRLSNFKAPVAEIESFVTVLQNPLDKIEEINTSISGMFEGQDIDFDSNVFTDAFGGVAEQAPAVVSSFDTISEAIGRVNTQAATFSSGDLLGVDANSDKGVADYVAEYAQEANLPFESTIAILEATGLKQDEINAKAAELLEQAAAFKIFEEAESGSLFGDDLKLAIQDTQTGIEGLEDPVNIVKTGVNELGQALQDLAAQELTTTLAINIEGLEDAREYASLIQLLGGGGASIPEAAAFDPFSAQTSVGNDSIPEVGRLRS